MKTILFMTLLSFLLVILLFVFFAIMPSEGAKSEPNPLPKPAPKKDPWTRIATMIPGTGSELSILKDHWSHVDDGFGTEPDPEEAAIRRCLNRDLPMIADTLEEAIATAGEPDQIKAAQASALESVEKTISIMQAHLANLHKAACDAQSTVGRYLECRLEDVSPTGPFVPVPSAGSERPALIHRPDAEINPIPLRFDIPRIRIDRNGMEDDSIPY